MMSTQELVAEVHSADVGAARAVFREAIRVARERWIPGDAIADAMILELIDLGSSVAAPERVCAYLRGVATLVERAASARRMN